MWITNFNPDVADPNRRNVRWDPKDTRSSDPNPLIKYANHFEPCINVIVLYACVIKWLFENKYIYTRVIVSFAFERLRNLLCEEESEMRVKCDT